MAVICGAFCVRGRRGDPRSKLWARRRTGERKRECVDRQAYAEEEGRLKRLASSPLPRAVASLRSNSIGNRGYNESTIYSTSNHAAKTSGHKIRIWPLMILERLNVSFAAILVSAS
jgi:hypothetical protein